MTIHAETITHDGLTFNRWTPDAPHRKGEIVCETETWRLAVEGLHIAVKNYGESTSEHFSGWRIIRGASPSRVRYESREAAMSAVREAAKAQAKFKLAEAQAKVKAARACLLAVA